MGSLVVGYTVCGAFIFQAIEDTEDSSDLIKEVEGCPVCRNERMRLLFEGDGEKKHNCTGALEHCEYLQHAQSKVANIQLICKYIFFKIIPGNSREKPRTV